MGCDNFVLAFINILKQVMLADENHQYAKVALKFMAKFATSYDDESTHPVLVETFHWILNVKQFIIIDYLLVVN